MVNICVQIFFPNFALCAKSANLSRMPNVPVLQEMCQKTCIFFFKKSGETWETINLIVAVVSNCPIYLCQIKYALEKWKRYSILDFADGCSNRPEYPNTDCNLWVQTGQCEENYDLMREYCQPQCCPHSAISSTSTILPPTTTLPSTTQPSTTTPGVIF